MVGTVIPVTGPADELLGTWVAVDYLGQAYPGIITSMDTDGVEVKAMAKVWYNRYIWPRLDDSLTYDYCQVLSRIPQPVCLTRHRDHVQIDPKVFRHLQEACTDSEWHVAGHLMCTDIFWWMPAKITCNVNSVTKCGVCQVLCIFGFVQDPQGIFYLFVYWCFVIFQHKIKTFHSYPD